MHTEQTQGRDSQAHDAPDTLSFRLGGAQVELTPDGIYDLLESLKDSSSIYTRLLDLACDVLLHQLDTFLVPQRRMLAHRIYDLAPESRVGEIMQNRVELKTRCEDLERQAQQYRPGTPEFERLADAADNIMGSVAFIDRSLRIAS